MDYSMLVGIHDCARAEEEALQNENMARESAGCGRETSESEECDSGERYDDDSITLSKLKANKILYSKENNFHLKLLGGHTIRLQIHLDVWDNIMKLYRKLIYTHCPVLKVSFFFIK